jgi:glucose/arabinose dehydrogenase
MHLGKKRINKWITVSLLLCLACGGGSGDDSGGSTNSPDEAQVTLAAIFPNLTFDRPVAMLQHPIDDHRWYVVELGGRVLTVADDQAPVADVFIDIIQQVAVTGEGGLLAMAFHPDFAANGQVYLSYTAPGAPLVSRISQFKSPDAGITADPNTEVILLSVDQPFANHNGGQIGFGRDGYLYIGLGDGGSMGDPRGHAQNVQTLLGAFLRIDVNTSDAIRNKPYAIPPGNPYAAEMDCDSGAGCPEIHAWGFRNPWRWSFDMLTGELWVGDVGQNEWEEIDLLDVDTGRNFGWNLLEGNHCYQADTCDAAGKMPPVAEYDRSLGASVTGGYVYRGSTLPQLAGNYIFGDFISGRIFRLAANSAGNYNLELLLDTDLSIVSFAQDRNGEIYVLDFAGGQIYKVVPAGDKR